MFRFRYLPPAVLILLLTASAALADLWYRDADEDGWGDPTDFMESPTQPFGYVALADDCDDTMFEVHPGAFEIPADGVDQDCDGYEMCFEDIDFDRWGSAYLIPSGLSCTESGVAGVTGDCDDWAFDVHPGAEEIVANGIDDDCDGYEACYADGDDDGFGTTQTPFVGSVDMDCVDVNESDNGLDCDDAQSTVHPGAVEIWYDDIDMDCDGMNDFDQDHDGFVAEGWEARAGGTAPGTGDCDDAQPTVHPGALEICGDGLDNDCDTEVDESCLELGILSISDVGNDQGGQVRLAWNRSADDDPGAGVAITAYDIYRRIDAYKDWPAGDWDFIAQVPASGEDVYHAVVPTLCDSTDAGVCWSVFFLRARTASPFVFEDCAPDSGYSIDNLAPAAPLNLVAAYSATGVDLQWDESEAADFDYFRIYRSTDPGFTPAPDLLVHATAGTAWTDPVADVWSWHYQVTAVDFAGNEGPPTAVQEASGVDLPAATGRLVLHPNAPNPFNPVTTILYELPAARRVRLEVFALDGRRVAVLVDGLREAGLHRVTWEGRGDDGRPAASGSYIFRLDADGEILTRRMVMIK